MRKNYYTLLGKSRVKILQYYFGDETDFTYQQLIETLPLLIQADSNQRYVDIYQGKTIYLSTFNSSNYNTFWHLNHQKTLNDHYRNLRKGNLRLTYITSYMFNTSDDYILYSQNFKEYARMLSNADIFFKLLTNLNLYKDDVDTITSILSINEPLDWEHNLVFSHSTNNSIVNAAEDEEYTLQLNSVKQLLKEIVTEQLISKAVFGQTL